MKSRNKDLVKFFEAGFGIHHAGMLRSDRTLTERLFSDGLLKVQNILSACSLLFKYLFPATCFGYTGACLHCNSCVGCKSACTHSRN